MATMILFTSQKIKFILSLSGGKACETLWPLKGYFNQETLPSKIWAILQHRQGV
jgi:hypothetical protein